MDVEISPEVERQLELIAKDINRFDNYRPAPKANWRCQDCLNASSPACESCTWQETE